MGDIMERGRISARCARAQQERIEAAAALCGATANQFVLQAALEKAERVIERERVIVADRDDAAMIMNLLENPPSLNAAMTGLLSTYKKKVADGRINTTVKSTGSPTQ